MKFRAFTVRRVWIFFCEIETVFAQVARVDGFVTGNPGEIDRNSRNSFCDEAVRGLIA